MYVGKKSVRTAVFWVFVVMSLMSLMIRNYQGYVCSTEQWERQHQTTHTDKRSSLHARAATTTTAATAATAVVVATAAGWSHIKVAALLRE